MGLAAFNRARREAAKREAAAKANASRPAPAPKKTKEPAKD